MQVTLYGVPGHPYSEAVKQYLTQKGVAFTERDVSQDYNALLDMVRLSQQQEVIPVTAVDGQVVVGFDRPRLDLVLTNARTARPTLGAAVADASRQLMKRGSIPVFGAYVGKVAPGSPGARLGLQPGDIITELNFRPIRNAADVEAAMETAQVGGPCSVAFIRGERTLRGSCTL
jgi:S1-C subfamily serine protease